jgi:spore germination cell wall hydrolase CwlJ-like protein
MKLLSNFFSLFIIIAIVVMALYGKPKQQASVELSERELFCLVQNVYFESQDQPEIGQAAVAYVTLKRLKHPAYPKSVCEVVWQKNWDPKKRKWVAAFSWTLDGKSDRMTNMRAIERAADVFIAALRRKVLDVTRGRVVNFHNPDLASPTWAKKAIWSVRVGDHVFSELANR